MEKKTLAGARFTKAFPWILFFVFFGLYLFWGLYASAPEVFPRNFFFDTDNHRAFMDLTDPLAEHYRVKVHPLFMLLIESMILSLQNFFAAVQGAWFSAVSLFSSFEFVVAFAEAVCGGGSVFFLYKILCKLNQNAFSSLLFAGIYGFSFHMLVYAGIPETYIFAAFSMVSFFYFILTVVDREGPLTIMEMILLFLWGILCFGITMTNALVFLMGLIWLGICKKDRYVWAKLAAIFAIDAGAGYGLCLLQSALWQDCDRFWDSMMVVLDGGVYNETRYMDWTISAEKTVLFIRQALGAPLLCPEIYLETLENGKTQLSFATYTSQPIFLLTLIVTLLAVAGTIYLFVQALRTRDRNLGFCVMLTIVLGFHLGMHYFYGYYVAFIYTAHFYFLIVILMATALARIPLKPLRIALHLLGIVLFCTEVMYNQNAFQKAIELGRSAEGLTVSFDIARTGLFFGLGVVAIFVFASFLLGKIPGMILRRFFVKASKEKTEELETGAFVSVFVLVLVLVVVGTCMVM